MSWIDHAVEWGAPALARLLEHASQPLVLLGPDGSIRFSNPAAQAMLAFGFGELIDTSALDVVHPDDQATAVEAIATLLATPGLQLVTRLRLRSSDGSWLTVAAEGTSLVGVDDVGGILLGLQDLSELYATERALESSELRFRDFADRAGDFIFRYRLSDPPRFEYVNPVAEALTGYTAEALVADPELFTTLLPGDEPDRLRGRDWAGDTHHTVEFPIVAADGTKRWVQLQATVRLDGDRRVETIDGIVRDLTELREHQDDLLHRAMHDSLTGLPNRALFYERLEQALRRTDRVPGSPVVLFLDLDRFKAVNDAFGHAAGDEVLVEIGRRITSVLRPGDTVARLGGDEFLLLCEDVTADADLDALVARLRAGVEAPIEVRGETVTVSSGIGHARARRGDTADAMVGRADLAMYADKR